MGRNRKADREFKSTLDVIKESSQTIAKNTEHTNEKLDAMKSDIGEIKKSSTSKLPVIIAIITLLVAITEGADTEFHGSKKLDRLQKKAEKAGKKTEAARKKLPKKTEYSLERVFDEKTGRAKYVLTAVKKEKLFTPDSPVKKITGRLEAEASNFAHSKVAETE